jgi:hypothetical protein
VKKVHEKHLSTVRNLFLIHRLNGEPLLEGYSTLEDAVKRGEILEEPFKVTRIYIPVSAKTGEPCESCLEVAMNIECICIENDGSGSSVCGMECKVHKTKENL